MYYFVPQHLAEPFVTDGLNHVFSKYHFDLITYLLRSDLRSGLIKIVKEEVCCCVTVVEVFLTTSTSSFLTCFQWVSLIYIIWTISMNR